MNNMQIDDIKLRRLKDCDEDYHLLEKWYQEEEVYSQFEQRILKYEEIKNKYYPRTKYNAKIPVYMILYSNKPVGIIQYQKINKDNQKLYGINDNDAYEIDIFIGEINYHNKGIGTKSINIINDYLFSKKNATKTIMCPTKNNAKAKKCYEKCGFVEKKKYKTNNTVGIEEEFILMTKEK